MDITGKAVVVFAKRDKQLCFFKIYDYETQQEEARQKFIQLMLDATVSEYRMMTIETFFDTFKKGELC